MKDLTNMESRMLLEKRIEEGNRILLAQPADKFCLGLWEGDMGICIYFHHLARITGEKQYEKKADDLLNYLYQKVFDKMAIDLEQGLAGIGWGLLHLIKNKFVEGNPNHILCEADDHIFKTLNFDWLDKTTTTTQSLLNLLVYLMERLIYFSEREKNKDLFQDLIIKIINKIDRNLSSNPQEWKQPLLFSLDYILPVYLILLGKLYALKFYNYKINKICDEITPMVLSVFPIEHANRLYLLLGVRKLLQYIELPRWKEYAALLEQSINHDIILRHELRSKNIGILSGVSGYCWLLSELNQCSDTKKELPKDEIIRKIAGSIFWEECYDIEQNELFKPGLMNGFAGIAFTYFSLLK